MFTLGPYFFVTINSKSNLKDITMKKTLVLAAGLLLTTLTLSANSNGEEIFKTKCTSCHLMLPPGAMAKPGTAEFKKAIDDLKAPPMAKVATMIKMQYKTKEAFVKFMTEYITKPDASKTVCMKQAVKGFGLMPAIGANMSEKEKMAVADWIYDNAKVSPQLKSMKCGAGKCGGGMAKQPKSGGMKCAPGKCGGK